MGVLDILFPISCLECGGGNKYLCNNCLPKVGGAKLFCLECHKPSIDGATHVKCRKKRSIDFAYSPWDYGGVIRKAILKLKYNFAYTIANELADRFTEKIQKDVPILPKSAVLIPIPLYRSRQNWRGFNQTEELGKIIAQKLSWEYVPNALRRTKKTTPQADLKGKDRAINLKGVFSLSTNYSPSRRLSGAGGYLPSTNYIVFDDVLTTGSTLKEACKVLKHGGVKIVWGLTIAA